MSRNSGNGAGLEYGEMGDRLREARVSRGLSLRGLAERLGVSPSTAETHRRNIMRKLDVHNVADLTKYAIREGLTTLDAPPGRKS